MRSQKHTRQELQQEAGGPVEEEAPDSRISAGVSNDSTLPSDWLVRACTARRGRALDLSSLTGGSLAPGSASRSGGSDEDDDDADGSCGGGGGKPISASSHSAVSRERLLSAPSASADIHAGRNSLGVGSRPACGGQTQRGENVI